MQVVLSLDIQDIVCDLVRFFNCNKEEKMKNNMVHCPFCLHKTMGSKWFCVETLKNGLWWCCGHTYEKRKKIEVA